MSSGKRRLPALSMFLPVYNEKEHLETVVASCLKVLPDVAETFELILVDDGSKDGSSEIADRLSREHPEIRVVHHEKNQGYGGAVRSGIRACRLPYIFFMDGDGQFDVREIEKLVPHIYQYDIVAGRRQDRQDPWIRKLFAFGWTMLTNVLMGIRIHDMDCAFKLFRAEAIQPLDLRCDGNMISAEFMTLASRRGASIYQLPVHHYPRVAGEAKGVNAGVILRAFRELLEVRRRLNQVTEKSGAANA